MIVSFIAGCAPHASGRAALASGPLAGAEHGSAARRRRRCRRDDDDIPVGLDDARAVTAGQIAETVAHEPLGRAWRPSFNWRCCGWLFHLDLLSRSVCRAR